MMKHNFMILPLVISLLLITACSPVESSVTSSSNPPDTAPPISEAESGEESSMSASVLSKYEIMLQQKIEHNHPLSINHSEGRRKSILIRFVDKDGNPVTGLYIRVTTDNSEINNEKSPNIGYSIVYLDGKNEYVPVDENGEYIWYCSDYSLDTMHRLTARNQNPNENPKAVSHEYYLDLTTVTANEFTYLWDKDWI